MTHVTEHEFEREARRVLRRLVEPGSFVSNGKTGEFALYQARDQWRKPVLRIAENIWNQFVGRGLVLRESRQDRAVWVLSDLGLACWRRLEEPVDPFRAQHQWRGTRTIQVDDRPVRVTVNDAESPLVWLHRRKGPAGKPLVNAAQFEAGERMRRDFTLAALDARVTMDWDFSLGAGKSMRRPGSHADMSDRTVAARQRLDAAIRAVGPGLADMLVEVCCSQRGLEEIERSFGWPQRSGKVVLQIALDRLVAHYDAEASSRRRERLA